MEDNLLARAEALAASDISKSTSTNHMMRTEGPFGHADMPPHNPNMPPSRGQLSLSGFGPHMGESMLEQLSNVHMPMGGIAPEHNGFGISSHGHTAQMYSMNSYAHSPMTVSNNNLSSTISVSPDNQQPQQQHTQQHTQPPPPQQQLEHTQHMSQTNISLSSMATHTGVTQPPSASISPSHPHSTQQLTPQQQQQQQQHPEMDSDPRELEAFAEHFKQRRIKLGVTQADVGCALGKLKIPGVGSLSQSTICRFESLTLSHNNMIALKPVLQTWLEEAETAARQAKASTEAFANAEKKRKRTSIAAPEKRSLEAYFAIQPRPSGEKIAQIAEKLDLKKNVVRVWFCNQRQKQKRMKFSATVQGQHSPVAHS